MRRFVVKQPLHFQDDKVWAEGIMFTEGHLVIFDLYSETITIYKDIDHFPDTMDDMYIEIEWIDQVEEASA